MLLKTAKENIRNLKKTKVKIAESIINIVQDKFGLKKEEAQKVLLLLIFSFSLGFFVAFYFVPANSEFVNYFGSAQLPYAYIASGILGTIALLIYSYIQKRSNSKKLFITALIIMLIIASLSRLSLFILKLWDFSPEKELLIKKAISFFVFVWAWPFIALTATITGGLALRLFNLLEVKKFYGIVNLGGVLAAIIGYFSIPLILKYLSHHYDLIIIGSTSIFAAIFLLFYIYKRFPEDKETTEISKNLTLKKIFDNFSSKRFLIWIFVGAMFSTIAIYIVDFGFLITIKHQTQIFPDNESVARFMAVIFGLLKVGEFLISIFSGRILTTYGLRFGLIMLPVTITIFELGALGTAYTIGAGSIVFLAMMTLNKMFERILRRGVDDPSFNVLYQTLPDNQKLYIQTRVGVIQQASIALAGLILLVIYNLSKITSEQLISNYPVYVLPFLLVWIWVAMKLYSSYKQRIKQILADKKLFKFEYYEKDIFASDVLQKYLLTDKIDIAKFSVVVLSETNPRALENYASFLLKIDDTIIRKAILNNIDLTYSEKLSSTIEAIGNKIGFKERELRKLILQALFNLDFSELKEMSFEELDKLVNSDQWRDKILVLKYLYKNHVKGDEKLIARLLDENDKRIKLAAIKIAGKRNSSYLHRKLIDLLKDPEYNNILVNIFVEIGDPVLDDLESLFRKEKDIDILLKIIQIYAKIESKKSQRLLLTHINYPDRDIQKGIINALYYCGYRTATETEEQLIKAKIYETVDNILWFYLAIKDTVRQKNTLKLIQSLDLELENSYNQLFTLLSFIYSEETIDLIRTNIIGENTIFAIELIDNFIDPEIKRIIIPLFEKISLGQKIKKLKRHFHINSFDFEDRLKDILLQDYSKTDVWSKVKAIEILGKKELKVYGKIEEQITAPQFWEEKNARSISKKLEKYVSNPELIACLFHPTELIYTTVAKILHENNPQLLQELLPKLDKEKQERILYDIEHDSFLVDRIKFLKRIFLFYTIPEKSLVKLAKIIANRKMEAGDTISFFDRENKEKIFIVVKGKITVKSGKTAISFGRNQLIIRGLSVSQEAKEITADKKSNILIVNRFEYFNLLAMENELIQHLFNRMQF